MLTKNKIRKSNTMQLIELKFDKELYELLLEDYLDNKISIIGLSEKYGISTRTVQKWLKMYDIPRRHITFI